MVDIPKPQRLGLQVLTSDDIDLAEVAELVDWGPFFWTWEIKGRYPQLLDDPEKGPHARELLDEGKKRLRKVISEKLFKPRVVYGLWPANAVGDDVELYDAETGSEHLHTFHFLRQQQERASGDDELMCLSDYIAPKDIGIRDHLGGFAVTVGEVDEIAEEYKQAGDDYTSIMYQAIGDRLAEALTEWLHQKVRQEWRFGASENLSVDELIDEKYRGIRPAAGYPACPDHREKETLWQLLNAEENAGMKLTESFAMFPASSVSGLDICAPCKPLLQDLTHRRRPGQRLRPAPW